MRKWSILLLLAMLCQIASITLAETEGDFTYAVQNGQAVITAYTGSASELSVPDTLGGYPVTSIRYCAFRDCTDLVRIALPDSISTIGSNAFQNCSSLSQVQFSQGLTAIGTHAFYDCINLKQLTLPESIDRLHPYAFYGCSAAQLCSPASHAALVLTAFGYSFTDPDFPQLSLIARENNDGLRTFTVTDCDESAVHVAFPEGVTAIDGYAFFNCTSLTEITIPDGVTEIAYSAFEGCSALTQIILPASVTHIAESAFLSCPALTIIAPESSAGHAFANVNGLTWRAP